MSFELELLGGAMIRGPSGPLQGPATQRYPIALLALLACAPAATLSRGKLAGLLWPESPEKTARNRLNTYVHRLRSELGKNALVSVGGDLRLDHDVVTSDVYRFRQQLDEGNGAAAIEHYRGPLLDGFALGGSSEFEWHIERERDRLHRRYVEAIEALAEDAEERGEDSEAARWWRERMSEDPYDSRVALRLMEALEAAGNRAEAMRTAHLHSRRLKEDLDVEPDPEIGALVERLKASGRTFAGAWSSTPAHDATSRRSLDPQAIAILPFEELGGGEEVGTFGAGLHNDLLTMLSRVAALTVISRTSVLRYRNNSASIREIGRKLGVGTVLEGGIQQAGGRMRLNVQLIDVDSDDHRWAETYDRELTAESLFEIQTELAERIVESLRAELGQEHWKRAEAGTPTDSLEAYRLQAQGRWQLDRRTREGISAAVEYFRRALARDPEYPQAWVGLADSLSLLYDYGFEDRDIALPRAEEAARRALELDPNSAEARASLGLLHSNRHHGLAAIQQLKQAVRLRPSYAEAHNWLSWVSMLLGREHEALESAERAVELDPLSPEAVSNLSLSNLTNGNLEEALLEARRVTEIQPTWTTGPFYEGLALYHLGRFEEAASVLRDLSVPWAEPGPSVSLALALLATGNQHPARHLLGSLQDGADEFAVGLIHAALGNSEQAFQAFRHIEEWAAWPTLSLHHFYPGVLNPLRLDPRYSSLLETVARSWGVDDHGRPARHSETGVHDTSCPD